MVLGDPHYCASTSSAEAKDLHCSILYTHSIIAQRRSRHARDGPGWSQCTALVYRQWRFSPFTIPQILHLLKRRPNLQDATWRSPMLSKLLRSVNPTENLTDGDLYAPEVHSLASSVNLACINLSYIGRTCIPTASRLKSSTCITLWVIFLNINKSQFSGSGNLASGT